MSIVLDLDDTLIDTTRRMQAVWQELLGCQVALRDVEVLGLPEIFGKYASSEQKEQIKRLQQRFWDILLCIEEIGLEFTKLDEAIPYAASVLQAWSENHTLVYLTGRPETTRELTMSQLKQFDFPADNTLLVMYKLDDYARARGVSAGPTLIDARAKLFAQLAAEHEILGVIDDYPGYFSIYKEYKIPDKIGLLRSEKYSQEDFLSRGATCVVQEWDELQDCMPGKICTEMNNY